MPKVIFNESQIKKIIENIILENDNLGCDEKLLKDLTIYISKGSIGKTEQQIKEIINKNNFEVRSISGNVLLNGKQYNNTHVPNRIILTPRTTIKICGTSKIFISGGGLPEALIFLDVDTLKFNPQHA